MGITKKLRDEIWSNVPRFLTKEEAMELCKIINKLYNKVYGYENKEFTIYDIYGNIVSNIRI